MENGLALVLALIVALIWRIFLAEDSNLLVLTGLFIILFIIFKVLIYIYSRVVSKKER
ncbi:hypothetical protein ACJQWY_03555 [Weissella kandleri]|uniref:hypothetical protein n=1 Tax=Weissella kandleri TaxID=1616 RepID=UPI00387EC83D